MLSEWPRGGCHSKGEIPFRFSSEWPRGGRTKTESLYISLLNGQGVVALRRISLYVLIRMANGEVAIVGGIPFRLPSEWSRGGRTRKEPLRVLFRMAIERLPQ